MAKELKGLLMAIFTKAISKTEPPVVMESISGKTKAISRATFRTASEQAKDSGRNLLEFQTNTKASTKTTRNGATESSHGPTVTYSRETTKLISATGMDKCTGQMEAITRGSGKMEFRMEKVTHFLIEVNCS